MQTAAAAEIAAAAVVVAVETAVVVETAGPVPAIGLEVALVVGRTESCQTLKKAVGIEKSRKTAVAAVDTAPVESEKGCSVVVDSGNGSAGQCQKDHKIVTAWP